MIRITLLPVLLISPLLTEPSGTVMDGPPSIRSFRPISTEQDDALETYFTDAGPLAIEFYEHLTLLSNPWLAAGSQEPMAVTLPVIMWCGIFNNLGSTQRSTMVTRGSNLLTLNSLGRLPQSSTSSSVSMTWHSHRSVTMLFLETVAPETSLEKSHLLATPSSQVKKGIQVSTPTPI